MSVVEKKRLIMLLLELSSVEELEIMLSGDFNEFAKDCIREEILKRHGELGV